MSLEKLVRVSLALPYNNNNIFLIRRHKPPFKGLLGLPGGKVEEKDLDYYEALVREMEEELSYFSSPTAKGAILYETIISQGRRDYFAMHIFMMPVYRELQAENVEMIPKDDLDMRRNEIIPSDYIIIRNILDSNQSNIYQGVTVSLDDMHFVTEWNDITSQNYTV
jgi:ADP-ribose pyrophosphatase YjhB (NUDIX family)